MSHFGARSAIQCKTRFSMEAVSAWFTRRAGVKIIGRVPVVVFALIISSCFLFFPLSVSIKLSLNCTARRAQCEFE